MPDPIHIISLGAGVQSSTMALMAAHGEITPMPVSAVFADTQAEPQSVYRWLEWLEPRLPFPVLRVTKGDMTHASLESRTKRDGSGTWTKSLIPAFVKNRNGTRGIMGRACTWDYKVCQLEKAARKLGLEAIKERAKEMRARLKDWKALELLADLGQCDHRPKPKEKELPTVVVQWIGISIDEAHRMKPARLPWSEHRWPLIDAGMKRYDCLRWMEAKGYPTPPRSACVYCPFHSDAEWRRLRDSEPKEFERAVQFERDLQRTKAKSDNMDGIPFLHSSLKMLDEVDFSTDIERGQGELFGNDCTGLCGV